ncbi:magnesium transporter [Nematocida sp. LUAm3]|nr:magnesium transporter [Nematocida sp. LUAm3]KAI5173997.1 magnesium transporter [Nematocida sp. LUAm2]KAI5177259.1 magnesium transporter [Nematocida sp. LUAm1]
MLAGESSRGALAELITIYRKMRKGKDGQSIYKAQKDVVVDESEKMASETAAIVPQIGKAQKEEKFQVIYNFYGLKAINPLGHKYLFYSKDASLLQSQSLEHLFSDPTEIFRTGFFWLNTFNPTDNDLYAIGEMFNIHNLTLLDIKEKNTDEKIEVFKHYTFISMKFFVETQSASEDIDFNILIFNDFILTFHDKPWISVQDTFNFIDLLSKYTNLTPSWVLYSLVIEFLQDIKQLKELSSVEISQIQEQSKDLEGQDLANILKRNFTVGCQVSNLKCSTRNKLDILSVLKNRCRKRITPALVQKYLTESVDDLREDYKGLSEQHKNLDRAQDTYLALLSISQTQEGNEMSKSMGRMSLVTLIISPCQLISGLWGMNVKLPGDKRDDYWPFAIILLISLLPLFFYMFRVSFPISKKKRRKQIS